MLPTETLQAWAIELQAARKTRTPLRHCARRTAQMTVEDGSAIQGEWPQLELAAGALNHPANGVACLAIKLAPRGERLKAGEVKRLACAHRSSCEE